MSWRRKIISNPPRARADNCPSVGATISLRPTTLVTPDTAPPVRQTLCMRFIFISFSLRTSYARVEAVLCRRVLQCTRLRNIIIIIYNIMFKRYIIYIYIGIIRQYPTYDTYNILYYIYIYIYIGLYYIILGYSGMCVIYYGAYIKYNINIYIPPWTNVELYTMLARGRRALYNFCSSVYNRNYSV